MLNPTELNSSALNTAELKTPALPTAGPNSTALTITDVAKTYPDGTVALDKLSLHASGGLFGLLGPNGAGKSSLLRTIATLQLPDSGSIHFAGIDVLQQPLQLRSQLGYLPQEFGVYPQMSCRALLEHLAILKGLTVAKQRQQQIDQLLALTNLSQVANKAVAQFSGGMRQRFGIAQALLGNPKLLILDEPTAGLDPQERSQLHNVLAEVSQSRLVILSSHLVDDIEQLCPQVAILLAGRIVKQGITTQLVAPLQGMIWQLAAPAQTALPAGVQLLQHSYLRGESQLRVYARHCPGPAFAAVPASLEDAYLLLVLQQANALPQRQFAASAASPQPEASQ